MVFQELQSAERVAGAEAALSVAAAAVKRWEARGPAFGGGKSLGFLQYIHI